VHLIPQFLCAYSRPWRESLLRNQRSAAFHEVVNFFKKIDEFLKNPGIPFSDTGESRNSPISNRMDFQDPGFHRRRDFLRYHQQIIKEKAVSKRSIIKIRSLLPKRGLKSASLKGV
jgi:hypothetical protein